MALTAGGLSKFDLEDAGERGLREFDVLGARSLWSLAYIKRDGLTLSERIESHADECALVEEILLAVWPRDESEALRRQGLDRSSLGRHFVSHRCRSIRCSSHESVI